MVVPGVSLDNLPPGFKFRPSDEEVIVEYLLHKAYSKQFRAAAIVEVDVYTSNPWDLPAFSPFGARDKEWYFFCPVTVKSTKGKCINRVTSNGYYKSTGKDRPIQHHGQTIRLKKTLVFYTGKAPAGERTSWIMYEYRLINDQLGVPHDEYVVCKIFNKSEAGAAMEDEYVVPAGFAVPQEAVENYLQQGSSQGQGQGHGQGQGRGEEIQTLSLFSVEEACPIEEKGPSQEEIQTLDLFPFTEPRPLKKLKAVSYEFASTSMATSLVGGSEEDSEEPETSLSLSFKITS